MSISLLVMAGAAPLICTAESFPDPVVASSIASSGDPASDGIVRDAGGRADYVVELAPEASLNYPGKLLHVQRFAEYHKPAVINAIEQIESVYGFQAHSVTSWAAPTFTAFLDDEQFSRLRQDPRIVAISPNRLVSPSLAQLQDPNAVWSDQVGQEVISWGKEAINASASPSNGSAIVYVLDMGVGQHQDLNVVERVNPKFNIDCGTRTGTLCDANTFPYVVGCYSHATAVAGVIGAIANGHGTIGINPGVRIVSVAASDHAPVPNASPACIPVMASDSTIAAGLDWIAQDIVRSGTKRTSVVNMSLNPNMSTTPTGWTTTIATMMQNLASSRSSSGAFIAQSAGNDFDDACNHAYSPYGSSPQASASDGIMVVGAINNYGQPVVWFPSHQTFGFWRNAAQFGFGYGSNFGLCVDTWAPGNAIYMPVANPSTRYNNNFTTLPAGAQLGTTVYSSYGMGSGTSFASPHIAGLASVLIERQNLTTPRSVEQAVRQTSYHLGSLDTCTNSSGVSMCAISIQMPSLNQLPPNSASRAYGELEISGTNLPLEINGYSLGTDISHNYTGDLPGGFAAVGSIGITFESSQNCLTTRQSGSKSFPVVNTSSGSFSDSYWNSGSGTTSTTWSVSSTCFGPGFTVVSQGSSLKVAPNPVVIPAGQTGAGFTMSWDTTGYWHTPGYLNLSVYGKQNGGTNPNSVVCLGNIPTASGSAPEQALLGEEATLWLTAQSCTPGSVQSLPPSSVLDIQTVTTSQ